MVNLKKLDRNSGVALWRQIVDDLTNWIRDDEVGSSGKLPPELTLAKHYGVNRHTIRQAVNVLANEGLVRIERGRGTFVQKRSLAFSLDGGARHSQSLLMQDLAPHDELLASGIMKADEKQAQGLEVEQGDDLAFIESLGNRDGRGFVLSRSFFPISRCPDIVEKISRLKSISDALGELGYRDTYSTMIRITAELPSNIVATKLDIAPSRPILKVIKLNTSPTSNPLAFSLSYFSGDLCQLTLTNI
jgi:GntR family transcriptional regulator, phosphonate transport system regulatory protein